MMNRDEIFLAPFFRLADDSCASSYSEMLDRMLDFYRGTIEGSLAGENRLDSGDHLLNGLTGLLSTFVEEAESIREEITSISRLLPSELWGERVTEKTLYACVLGIIIGVIGARLNADPLIEDACLGEARRKQQAEFGKKGTKERWAGRQRQWAKWRETADEIRAEYAPKVARGWPKLSTLEVARRVKERLQLTEQVDSIRKRIAPSK